MEKLEFFSRLPEELIHRILGFLTTKEAVKASFLSKSLQSSWLSSCPALHFDDENAFHQQKLQPFQNYLHNTMERISNHSITSFKFQAFYLIYDSETLDKYIGIALDGHVREICLTLKDNHDGFFLYDLPERVLSSSFLKSLSLEFYGGGELRLPPNFLGDGSDAAVDLDINLPCLQSLTLIHVSVNGEALERILKGCPSLEHLMFRPTETRSPINISHLKLKSVDASSSRDKFEVEAPCLERLHYTNHWLEDRADVNIKTTSNLKCLTLGLCSSPKEWLSKLLSNCTSLETLKLHLGSKVKTISISNPYVKNMVISYARAAEIDINCPMLLSLYWSARLSILLPSLSVINPKPNFEGRLHMCHFFNTNFNSAWFHKFRELLPTLRMAAMSLFWYYPYPEEEEEEEEDDQNGDTESLPTSSVKIELLYLMVKGPKSYYSFIMNGFLSACHPDTIHLASPAGKRKQLISFIEFFLEKIENWKDADGCYCSSKIKCWKHQLKGVEIQEFSKLEDKERDYYDFDDDMPYSDSLPLPQFRLKFQWTN